MEWCSQLLRGKWHRSHLIALFSAALGVAFASLVGSFIWLASVPPKRPIPAWEFPPIHTQEHWKAARHRAVHSVDFATPVYLSGSFANEWTQWRGKQSAIRFGTVHCPSVDRHVDAPFPDPFHAGVVYAISAWNSKMQPRSQEENQASNAELLEEIQAQDRQPLAVFRRRSYDVLSGWQEEGFALFFASPTPLDERTVLYLARSHAQPAVLKWWPHRWGQDRLLHTTIMQTILATASGLANVGGQDRMLLIPEGERRKPGK